MSDVESYRRWEQERRWRDELTDAAERIHAPLVRTQEFFLVGGELVNDLGQSLKDIIDTGVEDARWRAEADRDWQVELERRVIDAQEYAEIVALAKRREGALVSFWLIPDAVKDGRSALPGYNRERLKMFTRISVATESGVKIRYHSFDRSDRDGVAAMDAVLGGHQFDYSRSSEQIARDRRHLPGSGWDIDDIDDLLREAYDSTLARKFGGEWQSGRPKMDQAEAYSFASKQHDLIADHMSIINQIFALTDDPYERNRMAEPHRFNFAAAIDDRMRGKVVGSLSEAGEGARAENRNYDGDCPPAGSLAAAQLRSIGFRTGFETLGKVRGRCPTCKTQVEYDPCDPECSACGATGRDPRRKRRPATKQTQGASRPANKPDQAPATRRPGIHKIGDRKLEFGQEIAVGSTKKFVRDLATGEVVANDW